MQRSVPASALWPALLPATLSHACLPCAATGIPRGPACTTTLCTAQGTVLQVEPLRTIMQSEDGGLGERQPWQRMGRNLGCACHSVPVVNAPMYMRCCSHTPRPMLPSGRPPQRCPFPTLPAAPAAVYVNNSDVARFAIKNMTQGRALAALKVSHPPAAEAAAELLE